MSNSVQTHSSVRVRLARETSYRMAILEWGIKGRFGMGTDMYISITLMVRRTELRLITALTSYMYNIIVKMSMDKA